MTMKTIRQAVLMTLSLLLAVVSAERVRDEEIAAIESVERALIMKALNTELAQALQYELTGNFKQYPFWVNEINELTGKTVYCRKGDKSFTLSKLQEYLKTVTGEARARGYIFIPPHQSSVANDGILFNSRITTKEEQKVFPGKKSTHVECKLTRVYNTPGHMVTEFYMNLSPCTSCAPQLLKAYSGIVSPTNPVTIHLSRLWKGKGDDYKKCLAKLIKAGFKLVITNWYTFAMNYLKDEQKCLDEATSYSQKQEFKDQEDILAKAITEAEDLAKVTPDPTIDKWCPEVPKWCD